ncbi:peroxisomal carnitine O-octanoyltransferase-like [Saccoglossus kowalevskii]|uniref:Peroxisomal carnitine O-octanoyltransferase-like n=1 Tax=Saccoglossus kowalevskii TaxID=10224 RepID=A0ABM0MY31_SACKO|nr:PREDICTED: peroxisomal carnitine O-octanoyltransferase-like [Saccoglossus kowalevskii]
MLSIIPRRLVRNTTSMVRLNLNVSRLSRFSTSTTIQRTFQYDDTLPPLPVPPLQQTLSKYIESVKPHVSPAELENTTSIVKAFGDGIGKELHMKLLEKAEAERNWLEVWWENIAYLSARGSTPLGGANLGFMFPLMDLWPSKEGTQVERCALVLWNVLKYWEMLRKETLPVETDRDGNKISMTQYLSLFNTSRVPGTEIDTIVRYFKTAKEGNCPDHIIVLRKGNFYRFKATYDDGKILSAPELQRQLQYIKSACDNKPSIPSVGMLTALDRTAWAEARTHLRQLDANNESILNDIESSLLMISLEDTSAKTEKEISEQCLYGNGQGRWFDKCYTLISFENGTFGANFDHTVIDGICLVNHVFHTRDRISSQDGIWKGSIEARKLPDPHGLNFSVDDYITKTISKAAEQYQKEAENVELTINRTHFDRGVLKSKRVHPDAFMQLAMQYTYYKMYNRPAPTYETATTRQFYHGRTETLRTCTVEAIQWCKAMIDVNVSPSDRFQLFLNAINKHVQMMEECKNNEGCDRHLLGLQLIASENGIPLPELYKDPAYVKSGGNGSFILSSSLTGYQATLAGVPPMCTNGYSVFYSFPKNGLTLYVTSWKKDAETNATIYRENLEKTAKEMLTMVLNSDS